MMNPATLIKLIQAKSTFERNHPKFISFFKKIFGNGSGIVEGTIIEITVTRPGEEPIAANIRVQQSDLDLVEEIKKIVKENAGKS